MTQNHPQQPEDEIEPKEAAAEEQAADFDETVDEALSDEDQVSALEAELGETKDRMLRAMADVENTRRLAQRETEEARKYAVTGFARELLEVADNLSRALQSVSDDVSGSEQVKPLIEGIELTQKSLAACFERHKITKVEPEIGERFDHNRHQAMFEIETADHAPGLVVQVMQPGYVIADRLLRPAMVGVAKKPAEQTQPANVNTSPDDERGRTIDTSA